MSRDPELVSRIAPLALAFAASKGVALGPLLEKYRLPADLDLAKPSRTEVLITCSRLGALLDELALAIGEPDLGLALAKAAPRGLHGVGEFLVRSSPTIAQAVENLVRFNALFNPGLRFSSSQTEALVSIDHTVPGHADAMGRQGNEFVSALIVGVMRTLVDSPRFEKVWFEHAAPADQGALREFFGPATLEFGAATNGLSFDRALLAAPVKTGDAALFAYLEEHALAALAARPKTDDLIDKLRYAIREALKQGEPNVERLAVRLQLSGRTLQRRLADLKTSFQEVLDGVRYDLSRAYLRDEALDLSQVAFLLGYSELRAFDRAFKRWSGLAPREWRQKPRG